MAKVLLLHPKQMSAEADLALRLIARRRDVATQVLADDHPILVARALPKLRKSDAELFHAFGNAALAAAVIAGGRRIIFTPSKPPTPSQVAWLRAAMKYRTIDVICVSDTMRRFYVTRGIAAERCHTVRPGVTMSQSAGKIGDRAALRARLGWEEDSRIIYAPFEANNDSGHILVMWTGSLLHELDSRYKLLVWGQGPSESVIRDFETRLLDNSMFRAGVDLDRDIHAADLFAAADIILLTGERFGQPFITAAAMASGKPIISTTTPAVCEMLEDRHTALLAAGPTPRHLSQRILDLYAYDTQRWKIADRARAEAYDYFTESQLLAAIDSLYGK